MTDPIPSAGETTIIGLPAIQIPITTTGDRPLTQEEYTLTYSGNVEVSRSHAVFRRVGDTFAVYDSGSLNGTYVNRQRVDHQQLRNGDEIMIGKFRLVFFTKSAVIA